MKKIYFLFLFCVFTQVLSAQSRTQNQNNKNVYALAFGVDDGFNCSGIRGWCPMAQSIVNDNDQSHKLLGDLWFDEYGHVMLELNKSSLSKTIQDDIYQDGFLSLPYGLYLPRFILQEENLLGIVEKISSGDYRAIEKEETIIIDLGKMN